MHVRLPSWRRRQRTSARPAVQLGRDRGAAFDRVAGIAGGTGSRPGIDARSGGLPGIPLSGTRGPRMDGKASSRPWVYGCSGRSKIVWVAPSSSTWPAYITISRSEKWLIRDMSWVTKMTAKP